MGTTLRHRGCLVESKATGSEELGSSVGQFSCSLPQQQGLAVAVGCSLIWLTACLVYQTVLLSVFSRFSHFHNGFCGLIAADVNRLPLVWFLLNGPLGLLQAL